MGPNGIQIADHMVEQLRILQKEKANAKAYATEAKAAKGKESSLYNHERDFSFADTAR